MPVYAPDLKTKIYALNGAKVRKIYFGNSLVYEATLNSYTITFSKGGKNAGSWESTTKIAYYGDTLSRSGNVVTCKQGSTGTNRWTNTFTPGDPYNVSYSSITTPIAGAQIITATTSVKTFTLTVTVTNASYGTLNVSRTSSPYQGASTGTLITSAGAATIYYGDILTGSATAKSTTPSSLTKPSKISFTDTSITAKNDDANTVNMYYNTSQSHSGSTSLGSVTSGSSKTANGLTVNTTYYFYSTRVGTKYSVTSSYSGTGSAGAQDNITAAFVFSSSSTTVYSAYAALSTSAETCTICGTKKASACTYVADVCNHSTTYIPLTSVGGNDSPTDYPEENIDI